MNPVYRIYDANLNRAGEALRTLEEYARFVADSPAWSERLKRTRHKLAHLRSELENALPDLTNLAAARDIDGDVGANLKTTAEKTRPDVKSVAVAALRRATEALRVLSEYAKLEHSVLADEFEKLRYDLYSIEPLILSSNVLREKLAKAHLYVLVTTHLSSADPKTVTREAIAGGADIIQMREKDMEDGEFYALAAALAEICRQSGTIFLVNDRPHIASLVDASGIHGGQGDLPVNLVRRLIGYDKIIGRSTSAPMYAERALVDGADYIGVGPVYETNTKVHRAAVGLEYVSWAAKWGKLPFFAIGSVNRNTIDSVLDAGAKGVAICTAITKAHDIAAEAAWFKKRLDERR